MFRNTSKQKGQGMVEYLLIVAIMAVGSMGILRMLGNTTYGKFAQITTSLQGGSSGQVRIERVKPNDFAKKDMSTFFRGSRSNRSR